MNLKNQAIQTGPSESWTVFAWAAPQQLLNVTSLQPLTLEYKAMVILRYWSRGEALPLTSSPPPAFKPCPPMLSITQLTLLFLFLIPRRSSLCRLPITGLWESILWLWPGKSHKSWGHWSHPVGGVRDKQERSLACAKCTIFLVVTAQFPMHRSQRKTQKGNTVEGRRSKERKAK